MGVAELPWPEAIMSVVIGSDPEDPIWADADIDTLSDGGETGGTEDGFCAVTGTDTLPDSCEDGFCAVTGIDTLPDSCEDGFCPGTDTLPDSCEDGFCAGTDTLPDTCEDGFGTVADTDTLPDEDDEGSTTSCSSTETGARPLMLNPTRTKTFPAA